MPLTYDELSGSFILTQDPPSEVMVEVRGTGFELLGEQWSLSRNPLNINLGRAKESEQEDRYYIPTIELRTRLIRNLNPNLNLRYISPDTLYFKTEIKFRMKVPVKSNIVVDFESGYNLRSELTLSPDSVWISGPASFIDTVQAVYTLKEDLGKLKDSLIRDIDLLGLHVKGASIEPSTVKLTIPVEKFTEKDLVLLLHQNNNFDERELKTFPNEIKASFLVPLSKFEYLDTTAVKAEINFTEADLEKRKLKVELKGIPPYAKLLKMDVEEVEYIIR